MKTGNASIMYRENDANPTLPLRVKYGSNSTPTLKSSIVADICFLKAIITAAKIRNRTSDNELVSRIPCRM
jgi:hypothetical protein